MEKMSFVHVEQLTPSLLLSDHGGLGPIFFRRLQDAAAFSSSIDFVDFTIVPPGSTIGRHLHVHNEELYLIAEGNPIVCIGCETRRLGAGDIAIVRANESHELRNDTEETVKLFVVQVAFQ
jgi:uncharacterized cupin superfamily protein